MFGVVHKAEMRDPKTNQVMEFAVKAPKRMDMTEMDSIFREIEMVERLPTHPNIIRYYGMSTIKLPMLMIYEFAEHGNLLDLLQADADAEHLTVSALLRYSLEVGRRLC